MKEELNLLKQIERVAHGDSSRIAFQSSEGRLTYSKLWSYSNCLADMIVQLVMKGAVKRKSPILVYGHKQPTMLVAFLACMKSGNPYCPVDISTPETRILDIIESIGNPLILAACDFPFDDEALGINVIKLDAEKQVFDKPFKSEQWKEKVNVSPDDICYIIFTSGSTGKPKGVEISYANLDNFLRWIGDVGMPREDKAGKTFINQAPYSFDLSIMDTHHGLFCGGTIASMDKSIISNPKDMMSFLRESKGDFWVSTPSFVEMALAEKTFSEEFYPNFKIFYFCGERLTLDTAKRLNHAFPHAQIYNTYGPTESTVAISQVEVSSILADIKDGELLPVGRVKSGTHVKIQKANGEVASDGETGEILIYGDTLAAGYYRDKFKTEEAFRLEDDGRCYHTGDAGYMKDGQLFCVGRMDLQIKLHGYRIELGDIEKNLQGLHEVEAACVVPRRSGDKIRSLVAYIVAPTLSGALKDSKLIKQRLKEKLPDYMVPKKIVFLDALPMTDNGKIHRKYLEEKR